jgi:uncharacterized protein
LDPTILVWMALLMALAAALYSTVGHGGASAYLAIMALFALEPAIMRPTALALNLVVAGFAVLRFGLARQINLRLAALFAVSAAPAAFVGGMIEIPPAYYRPLVGAILCLAALRLLWQPARLADREVRSPPLAVAVPVGAGLGLLAGLTGTGGGIFLSPLIILLGWEEPRRTSGVAATFILINSIAGLAGNVAAVRSLPAELPWLVGAVSVGAVLGTWLGVDRLKRHRLLQWLGLVLVIAGAKLLFSGA